MDLAKYNKLIKEVEKLKSEADRTAGKLDQLKEQLKNFDCETVKEARAKLKKVSSEHSEAEAELEEKLQKLEEEFGDKIWE